MQRIILSVAFMLIALSSFSQKIEFNDPTNHWYSIDTTTGCCIPIPKAYTTSRYDSTPCIYNGLTYLYLKTSVCSFLIREDAGRVYAIGTPDSVEKLLYDFNLVLNDTIRSIYPTDTIVAWVSQMDSTQLGGQWYKVWHFDGEDHSSYYADSVRSFTYNVIEGIGCVDGLYYPASPYSLASFSQQLLCFKNHLDITSGLSNAVTTFGYGYNSQYDNSISCTEYYANAPAPVVTSGVQSVSPGNSEVIVAPDPLCANSRLILPYSITSGKVVILNELGQVINNASFQNVTEFAIGDKITIPGIYYYRVTDQSGKVFSGKFVNQ